MPLLFFAQACKTQSGGDSCLRTIHGFGRCSRAAGKGNIDVARSYNAGATQDLQPSQDNLDGLSSRYRLLSVLLLRHTLLLQYICLARAEIVTPTS